MDTFDRGWNHVDPVPFPKSLSREIVIRDEHWDDEETTQDNRNRVEPDRGRCHWSFRV